MSGGIVAQAYNTNIENCFSTGEISGENWVGGIVGLLWINQNSNVSIKDCFSIGDILAPNGINAYVGGIIGITSGYDNTSIINIVNCYSKGNITGSLVGGIIGGGAPTIITNCFSTGDITGDYTGGIAVGLSNTTLENCYSTGDISGNYVGGIAMSISSSTIIENSYSTGNILGLGDSPLVGGIVATIQVSDSEYPDINIITKCYALGEISSIENNASIGGIVGWSYMYGNTSSHITHNFWDIETTGISEAVGSVTGVTGSTVITDNFGLPSFQMKQGSTFIDNNWDFDDIWAIDTGLNFGYPYLQALPDVVVSYPPVLLIAESSDFVVNLTWQAPEAGSDGSLMYFRVYRLMDGETDWIMITETDNSTILDFTDSDVAFDTEYSYTITAVYENPSGESAPSNIATVVIPDNIVTPVEVQTEIVENNIVVTWEMGSDGRVTPPEWHSRNSFSDFRRAFIHFELERNEDFLAFTDELVFIDTNPEPDINYIYRVRAVYDGGESNWAEAPPIFIPIFNPPLNLTATAEDRVVNLIWEIPSEQNFGTCVGYIVYRDNIEITEIIDELSYNDTDIQNEVVYTYYVTAIYTDPDGESAPSNEETATGIVSDNDENDLPVVTALMGNYPNPFNPETVIRFSVAVESVVLIDIYNIRGQKVRTLLNDFVNRGEHSVVWNGRDDTGHAVGSGVYFYRMITKDDVFMRRMVLMK